MSAYHPVYYVEPVLSSDANANATEADSEVNKENSRLHSGRRQFPPSKRTKGKLQNSSSKNGRTPRLDASYRIEDERLGGSEKRRKAEKYTGKEDRDERRSHSHRKEKNGEEKEDVGYPSQQDLYCQKSTASSSSWEDASFSYIAGTMYPPQKPSSSPSSGINSPRYPSPCCSKCNLSTPGGWPMRGPVCRPRFWKFLLLVVVLLMMAQFSLNMLFYRNYDSLFYVNVTSPESLASFESRVRWVSSKLPWVYSTTERPVTVTPLHILTPGSKGQNRSSVGSKRQHSSSDGESKGQNSSSPSSAPSEKIPDEGGGNNEPAEANATKASPSKITRLHPINASLDLYRSNSSGEGRETTRRVLLSKEKSLCPPVPPKLVGVLKVNRDVPTLEEQERSHPELEPGGRFRPAECRARHRVAVIVPYRDRAKHLSMFIYHIHPILERQQIDYAIYIVEQAGNGKFNRAMLLNVGALEALKQYPYDCFVFHDVDLLQEDDRNLYTCPEQPRHMSIAIDSMGYKLPYNDIFGGVSAMTVEQFRTVNGFSNKFWGWGGEDDDLSNRIKFHGFFISRYPANIGRYTMVSHKKEEPNPKRYQYLYDGKKRFKTDGLNSVKYKALDVQFRRLYTWIYVDLYPS